MLALSTGHHVCGGGRSVPAEISGRQLHTERERDRQTDRQTDRERDGETEKDTERQRERES